MVGSNGNYRKPNGQFLPGNPGKPPGTPKPEWRYALATVIPAAKLVGILKKLVKAAEAGEPWAIREVLDRCLGKSKETLEVDQQVLHDITFRVRFNDDAPRPAPALPEAEAGDLHPG